MCKKTKKKKRRKKKKRNFGRSYLGIGLSDFLQIWNVDSPSWRATLQQIWFQSDKLSPRYKSVKMTFSFFLSIYSRCGTPASWAARHTIVCLDHNSLTICLICTKCDTKIHRWTPFMCAKFQGNRNTHLCFIAIFQSVRKDKE